MDKRLRIAGIIGALAFSAWVLTSPSDPLPIPVPSSEGPGDSVVILAEDLERPRHIAVYGDDVFVTEREGRIRLIHNGTLLDAPVAVLRPVEDFDIGLSGIAVHPDYNENKLLYAYISYSMDDILYNRVLKITLVDNRLVDAVPIIESIPGSRFTNGGVIKFGPDGMLYVGTGTPSDSSHLPQDINSLAGKILRIRDDGSIPADNPYEDSPVYSFGHRNIRGMDWDSSGNLYVSEEGPDKNDKLSHITPGGNHGWPNSECYGPGYTNATVCYDPAIEPGGIVFSGGVATTSGHLLLASLRGGGLFAIDLNEGLPSQKVLLSGLGRIRDVVQDEAGIIYVITSNTDGKGFPADNDDRLLMLR
ncbi:MAG: PQQ-dependent sugar dehydrogenase [Cenarchaeum sp. SB0662_bin_33]|nr:PQQ-dependent sugar dehydrogenase [Cenarchaeum sp. SB0662_bin_33]